MEDDEAGAKIEDFTDLDEEFKESQKEKWQQELPQNEQRRNDLMPGHEKTQKISHKLQRLRACQTKCCGVRKHEQVG